MRRVWLAALLGIVLGFGLALAPGATVAPQRMFMQSNPPEAQLKGAVPVTNWNNLQTVLVAVITGLVFATPLFLIAKKRNR